MVDVLTHAQLLAECCGPLVLIAWARSKTASDDRY
jgi:hypothetical protein